MAEELDTELERIKMRKLKELMSRSSSSKSPERKGVLHLNTESFKELLKSEEKPVLVDFWAEWCAPCRMLSPIIEKLAEKYSGKVVFAKVNVDECPELANEYGIMAIPTLILFINGAEVNRIVGLVPEEYIEAMIKNYVK